MITLPMYRCTPLFKVSLLQQIYIRAQLFCQKQSQNGFQLACVTLIFACLTFPSSKSLSQTWVIIWLLRILLQKNSWFSENPNHLFKSKLERLLFYEGCSPRILCNCLYDFVIAVLSLVFAVWIELLHLLFALSEQKMILPLVESAHELLPLVPMDQSAINTASLE